MNSPNLGYIWNAPVSQPLSRTVSTNGWDTPPRRLVSPSPFINNIAVRPNVAANGRSPSWNNAGSSSSLNAESSLRHPSASSNGLGSNSSEMTQEDLWRRFRVHQTARQDEADFMLDILRKLDSLQAQVNSNASRNVPENVFDGQEQASAERKVLQERLQRTESRLRRTQSAMESDPFVLVLIDGDGILFDDELVAKGAAGGEAAADLLESCVKRFIADEMPHLPSNCEVVVKIYANTKGLSDVYHRSGVVNHPSKLDDFSRSLTRRKPLFDWIDVGSGRDSADAKISRVFQLNIQDPHCRHILLGCSHDGGHARTLKELSEARPDALDLVTLLEASPFMKQLSSLDFRTTKLYSILQPQNMNLWNVIKEPKQYPTPPVSSSDAPLSRSNSPSNLKEIVPPVLLSVTTESKNPIPLTWASTVKKPSVPQEAAGKIATPSSNLPNDGIPRNRKGERIDPVIKHDKDEVDRVKRMKLCNVHYLRNECPYDDACTHVHHTKPTATELKYLALVARMAPCMHGSWCEDVKCIYGHICPAPEGRRGELCIFGDQCRFPKELHKIDRTPVKTTRVG